jgi:hypothetical protein
VGFVLLGVEIMGKYDELPLRAAVVPHTVFPLDCEKDVFYGASTLF